MSSQDKPSLSEYWNQLNGHDWFYDYSDDHGVWKRGSENESRLRRWANQDEAYKELYDGFREHHFAPLYGRTQPEKPPQP